MKMKLFLVAAYSGFVGFTAGRIIEAIQNRKVTRKEREEIVGILGGVAERLQDLVTGSDPDGSARRKYIAEKKSEGATEEEIFELEETLFKEDPSLKS